MRELQRGVSQELKPERFKAELVTIGRNDEQIETAAGRLGLEPSVSAVRWQVMEDEDRRILGRDGSASGIERLG